MSRTSVSTEPCMAFNRDFATGILYHFLASCQDVYKKRIPVMVRRSSYHAYVIIGMCSICRCRCRECSRVLNSHHCALRTQTKFGIRDKSKDILSYSPYLYPYLYILTLTLKHSSVLSSSSFTNTKTSRMPVVAALPSKVMPRGRVAPAGSCRRCGVKCNNQGWFDLSVKVRYDW